MFGLFVYFFPSYFCFVVFLAICFSLTVSYVKAAADNLNLDTDTGIMQRADRVVYLGIGGIISGILDYYEIHPFGIDDTILMLFVSIILLFSLISTIQRILLSTKS